MTMRRLLLVLIGASIGPLACSDSVSVSEATEVSFWVLPQEMAPRASFAATLTIKNLLEGPLKIFSGMGCISFLEVDEAAWDDFVKGTVVACVASSAEYRFQPRETRVWCWELCAETESGQPLEPGEYHLGAALTVPGLEHHRTAFSVLEDG